MTFSSASRGNNSLLGQGTIAQTPLTQSRETGDVVPQQMADDANVVKAAPAQKSWAHFVAGG